MSALKLGPATIAEAAFQARVTDLCDWLNLWWHHTPDSRRSNAGMPDLLIVNLETGALLFAELKTQKGKVSAKQTKVLFAIDRGGNEAVVWRPDDWDQIAERLRRLAGGR